jgi:hypothetical protein
VFYPYPGTELFHMCRDRGYLPADYYERCANHRESILTFPSMSKQDIDEYYQRFTDVRKRDQIAKLRKHSVEHNQDLSSYEAGLAEQIEKSAHQG